MKKRKIRGHKRIWRDIDQWRQQAMQFDAKDVHQHYVKVRVNPYMTYKLFDIPYAEPRGETRKLILSALLDIYDAWKKELDAVGEPYYLKLWLYEPQITRSQVVCAARSAFNFYENTFFRTGNIEFPLQNYGVLEKRLKEFTWEHGLYENFIDAKTIGEPEEFISLQEYYSNRRWTKRKMAGPHRREVSSFGEETYLFKIGDVWMGSID